MAHSLKLTVCGFLLIGFGIAIGHATTADADQQPASHEKGKYHRLELPRFDPTVGENACHDEAQAYVLALAVLNLANQQADAAYMAWMDCVSMGKPTPAAQQLRDAPKDSVLITD